MAIEVREATPEEHEETGRVTALAYREFARPEDPDWEEYLARIADVRARAKRTTVLVAVEDGRILGSVTLELDGRTEDEDAREPLAPDEAHLRMLGVHPEARRRGIARALMEACVERARAAGRRRLTLNTTERMRAARAMYERMGFRRTPDRVFPDGFVLLGYEKEI
ncbi:MAG TPA: GNAT family N-acetyltransferase [Actinomycetota bacterium]|nr:GNAT family N-acetyltransferase [Actinomycetota bacterium]